MSFFRVLTGLVGGTLLGMLFAKKDGAKLRKELKGKSSKEIAEILGKELMSAGKDAKYMVKDIADSDEVQALLAKGEKEVKKAVKNAGSAVKKEVKIATASAKKTVKSAKKTVQKAVDQIANNK